MTQSRPDAQRDIQANAALEGMHEQPEDISNKARGHKANLSNPSMYTLQLLHLSYGMANSGADTSEQSKEQSRQELKNLGGENAFYGKQEAGQK